MVTSFKITNKNDKCDGRKDVTLQGESGLNKYRNGTQHKDEERANIQKGVWVI